MRTQLFLITGLCSWALVSCLSAFADDFSIGSERDDVILKYYELVVTSGGATPHEMFRMEPGGCLRGPLAFLDQDGKVMFALTAGTDYPAGCSKVAQ